MLNPITSFFLGLVCTCALFCTCLIAVVCAKIIWLWIKENLFSKKPEPQSQPQKSPVVKRSPKKPASIPKPVRSIEIDPDQVDKIYVKKIS